MNTSKLLPLLALVILLCTACEKNQKTGPFSGAEYTILGTYDSKGKPDYLVEKDAISKNLTDYIGSYLENGKNQAQFNPDLLTAAEAVLNITANSEVFLTFYHQDAGNKNSLAFYTYKTGTPPTVPSDISRITYIFPNAGNGTTLQPGDKVRLGSFTAGTSIGFILLRDSWDPETKRLDDGAPHYCSTDALNPEEDPALRRHAIKLYNEAEQKTIIGFEDIDRTIAWCDHDFNDVIFYCTVK